MKKRGPRGEFPSAPPPPRNECDMEKFGTLDSSEKAIAILVDGGHRRRNRKGIG